MSSTFPIVNVTTINSTNCDATGRISLNGTSNILGPLSISTAPLNAATSASIGTSTSSARADHVHQYTLASGGADGWLSSALYTTLTSYPSSSALVFVDVSSSTAVNFTEASSVFGRYQILNPTANITVTKPTSGYVAGSFVPIRNMSSSYTITVAGITPNVVIPFSSTLTFLYTGATYGYIVL